MYRFFDKKTRSRASANANDMLAQELCKPVIKTFKRIKVYARLKDSIWAADLAEIRSLFSKNRNVKYLLCVIDVFTKHASVKPLNDKKLKQFIMVLSKK